MALVFNGPGTWRWDERDQEVRLSAWLDSRLVLCRVSREAIEDHYGERLTPRACLEAARDHFEEITSRLNDLILRGRFDADGSVLLGLADW